MSDIPGIYNCFATISQTDGHLIVNEKVTVESMQAISIDNNVISITVDVDPANEVPQINNNDVYIYKSKDGGPISIYYGGDCTSGQSLGDGTNISDPNLQQSINDLLATFSDLL